jgi:hypothetical protein
MSHTKKERAEYNARRDAISKRLGINKNEYNRLRRVGQSLHRHGEDYAMGRKNWRYERNDTGRDHYSDKEYWKDVGKAFSKTKALEKRTKTKNAKRRLHYYHQSDPRGAALYASKSKLNQMNYNRDGHAIT